MDDFKFIENAFSKIKSGKASSVKELSDGLSKHFGRNITTYITPTKKGDSIFVMSVTPQSSTIAKVMNYMVGTETKLQAISDLWHSCKEWRLDIDKQILGFLSASELTALTLHEMRHIMDTDRIPQKLVNTIQFGVATSKISQRAALQDKSVQKILELPILSSCQTFFDKKQMKDEIKAERNAMKKEHHADQYAKDNGYLNPLLSAMDKLEKKISSNAGKKNLQDAMDYSMNIVNNLQERKNLLVKDDMRNIRKFLPDGLLKESVDEIYNEWFHDGDYLESYITESVEELVKEAYFTEFAFGKKLEPIQQNQLDYIAVRIETMKTVNDKMMILSYINSKLELCDYYMQLLNDPKLAKKYKVPHSMNTLKQTKAYLEKLRELALNKSIQKDERNIVVYYPAGYEG